MTVISDRFRRLSARTSIPQLAIASVGVGCDAAAAAQPSFDALTLKSESGMQRVGDENIEQTSNVVIVIRR